ncbi:NHLP bacteriocin export ABC transporter permease/ATPase subunit [Xanthobacteraceae bacterium A53D]
MPHDTMPPALQALTDGPIPLDAGYVRVVAGALDLYRADATRAGGRHKLFTVKAGQMVFPLGSGAGQVLGFPADPDLVLEAVDASAFLRELDAGDANAIASIEAWLEQTARLLTEPGGTRAHAIVPDTATLPQDAPARVARGLLWLTVRSGHVRTDLPGHVLNADHAPFALSAASLGQVWAQGGQAEIRCATSAELAGEGRLAQAFAAQCDRLAQVLEARVVAERASMRARIIGARAQNRAMVVQPFTGLDAGADAAPRLDINDPVTSVFRLVATAAHVTLPVEDLPAATVGMSAGDHLMKVARAARVRLRLIQLKDGWRKAGGQHLILFRQSDGMPVAGIARTGWRNGYDLILPDGSAPGAWSETDFAPVAYVLQRPLPDTPVNARGLMAFAAPLAIPLAVPVLIMALVIGGLGLVTPIATEILFDTVIPSASRPQLLQLVAGIAGLGLGAIVFEMVRNFLMLRMTTLLNADLEGAVWDRLLRLPAEFFRRYSAGDLALRSAAINQIRDTIGGAVMNTLLSSVFSVVSLFLLLYYSWKLALVALAVVVVQLSVTIILNWRMVALNRRALHIDGRLQSLTLQIITAINKVRVAGAEARAFGRWAPIFIERRELDFRKRRLSAGAEAFGTALSVVSTGLLIAMVGFGGVEIGISQYIAFSAAFGQFLSSTLSLAGILPALLTLRPLLERAKPLLEAVPEDDASRVDPGELRGDVELNDVSFHYDKDGPAILDGVSLRARPGEFIAIVGPSGAGKSTLLRILLGFEHPTSGSLFYDQQDVTSLDVRAVRRQMGVVLQNGHATTGSILDNILGGAPLTEEDAWEAARMAGLDEDIRQMPMGMHTFAGENATLLSGGQRQRLLIARAVVRRPRLLLFDEATSALDNRSQKIAAERLAGLDATRIVIAHRLSTIMDADRIYVLDRGRVVEEGTYAELIASEGLFADLARRQIG